MVVKFLSKYILEVIPSIVATVIGAYIVTHYINARPDAEKAKTEVSAPAGKPDTVLPKAAKIAPAKSESAEKQPAEKVEKSSETASAPSELRRSQPSVREKAVAKAAPNEKAAPVEPAAKEDNRDANEIARAAIERLRGSDAAEASRQEASRPQQRVSVTYTPPVIPAPAPVQQPLVQAAPAPQAPVVSVAPPLPEVTVAPAPQPVARMDDPLRPMPPADIPTRPLDIRMKQSDRTTVAEDFVSAAKSVFHNVIPGTN